MQQLRRLVQFCLGVQALGLLGSIFLIIPGLATLLNPSDLSPSAYGAIIALTVIGPLLGTVPTIAWWRLKEGRPSARRWTLIASVQNIFVLVMGVQIWTYLGHTGTWPFIAPSGITGVLGLIAFWRKDAPASSPKPMRTPSDSTGKTKDYIGQGASVAIVWLSNRCWTNWASFHGLVSPDLPVLLVEIQLALLLTTFVHELGHLLAGWAAGKILCSFQLGPVSGEVRNGAWKFEFRMRQLNGGSVEMVAPDLNNLRSRKAFSIIGGPVASLTMASLCIVATLLAPGHAWQSYWMLLAMMANFSIAGFLVNLIPLKPESLYSDGAQLYQVMKNGPWANVHFAFAMASSSAVSPVRARDYDVNVIQKAADSVPHGERGLRLRLFACVHYLDAGQVPEALVHLKAAEALWEHCDIDQPETVLADFVFINAFFKRDLPASERWWQRIERLPSVEKDAAYWRARTALLWLRGHKEEAREAWTVGDGLAKKLPVAGAHEGTRQNFEMLRDALEKPAAPEGPRMSLRALADAIESGKGLPAPVLFPEPPNDAHSGGRLPLAELP